jgi:hypothetical protein
MRNKINAIVFSRDRSAQLNLFLESVKKNAPDVFNISVVYLGTDEEYIKGYELTIASHGDVNFIPESENLKEQILGLIKDGQEFFSFFLDDDIIYNTVYLDDICKQFDDEDVACFSLRLGENTTKCYTLGAENVMHDIEKYDNFMKWDWSLHYLDFGYPFAMDGHIFRTSDIYKLVKKSKFSNIEELEMALFDFTEMFPRLKMSSYKKSALVGVPIARVQESIDNEMAMALKESHARLMRKEMNKKFVNESFIKLEEIDFSNISGCHQELSLGVELKKQKEENGELH